MSIADSIRKQLAPIHPEGYPFIGGFALASLLLFWLAAPLGWLGVVATAWCAYFFRDPDRSAVLGPDDVVSPGTGVGFVAVGADLCVGDVKVALDVADKNREDLPVNEIEDVDE